MKVLPKKRIVQQARWEKELAQVRCRCGPRRQVAIIRSPSLLYIICLLHDHYPKRKMAIILPTGQWYAPSAVINDAWYCMVLHGIA